MKEQLAGKIALVTGGNSGIGLATAKHFVKEGATVLITGRRQEQLDRAVEEIGANVYAVQGDVSILADLDRLFATIERTTGRLDIVVANAGLGVFVPFGSYTEEHLDQTFAVNVKGTVFTVQKALPLMPDGGTVVLLGSIAGVLGMPAFGVYSASKAALRSFTRCWAVDLKARGIRVNIVSPGVVPTPAYDVLGLTTEALESSLPLIPLGRVGTTEEVAKAIAFLASDDSSYITGAELFVDGGMTQV
ncbi:MAG: short-chain dehydrogenase/reductase [Chthonomonadaceae bacterium]|nr:short-chain dehydrogenase/reductase [Chthonomonadaceae bacterium]